MATIIFVGDVVPHDRTVSLFNKKDTAALFSDKLLSIIKSADYGVVNYEAPIAFNGKLTPIRKSGPNLYSSPETMDVLKEVGFRMVTLANNHFRDQGQQGVENTINHADTIGISHVGGGKNLEEARQIRYQKIGEKTFAFINVCEHEWSIAEDAYGGSNPYDIINIYQDLAEAKYRADYSILIIHGGIEHYPLPSPRMKREYRHLIELGADVIINHHQHCYSGYEIHKGKPIFYGLGNFCFDRSVYRNNGMWDKGFMLLLTFDSENSFKLLPISQCATLPNVQLLEEDAYKERIDQLNAIILDDDKLNNEFEKWSIEKSKQRLSQLNVFGNRFFDKIYKRGWCGSLYKEKRLYPIKDLLYCESHIETIKCMLNKLTD